MLAIISIIIFVGLAIAMGLAAQHFSVSMIIVGFLLTAIGTVMLVIVYCVYRVNSIKSKLQRLKMENEMLKTRNEENHELQSRCEELREKCVALEKENLRLSIVTEEAYKKVEWLEKRQANL